ncbi:MAG: ShlB/FhaC/HecB family hemolysin secretion/activation protein [Nitrosomonadales bacterium]|nr:ShlB/FhaC/HecB family hemolysin secretion/activation protein [Nitrosomonadales bacterium]
MSHKFISLSLFLIVPSLSWAAPVVQAPAVPSGDLAADEPVELHFTVSQYVVEGATLLSQQEIAAAVAPYIGKDKNFTDVQHALEALEGAYAQHGYSAVRVQLPEQELDKGIVRFRVAESRFGKVMVKDNRFVSEANVLNALPSVSKGLVPSSSQIARGLRLANENPSRQLSVVLRAGEKDNEVDANVMVIDSKPSSWGFTVDNSGSPETGRARLGLNYRNANAFNADHIASVQYVTSPQYTSRVQVLGGSYKIPFYRSSNSLEFFGGYSNVNAVIGGLSNFQGGGKVLSMRLNHLLERIGAFDSTISFGLDWRDFSSLQLTNPQNIIYNEIVVTPVSLVYAAQGRFERSDVNFNVSYVANQSKAGKGRDADFANYDIVNLTQPDPAYRILRYAASYSRAIGEGWQFRTALTGQRSGNVLVQGEQMRLGGVDAVRGFSEGSEGGETAARLNVEGYTPEFGDGVVRMRVLAFYDAGQATPTNAAATRIAGEGVGLRANYAEKFALRIDLAKIVQAGNDPEQQVGTRRAHLSLNATF